MYPYPPTKRPLPTLASLGLSSSSLWKRPGMVWSYLPSEVRKVGVGVALFFIVLEAVALAGLVSLASRAWTELATGGGIHFMAWLVFAGYAIKMVHWFWKFVLFSIEDVVRDQGPSHLREHAQAWERRQLKEVLEAVLPKPPVANPPRRRM